MTATRRLVRERFCGPPEIGNGGYVAGLLAGPLEGPAEVTLLQPTPLGVPLSVLRRDGAWQLAIEKTGAVVAWARPAKPVLSLIAPPAPPSFETACEASLAARPHPFPRCFVCGPERRHGDGLRVLAGPIPPEGRLDVVAAPWVPDASLRGPGEGVADCFAWAALDCPGAAAALDDTLRPVLLARITGELFGPPARVGERCVVMGWRIACDGRKHLCGTALYGEDGELRGATEQLWIEPRPRPA
jgi:hypothetical protein